MNELRQIIKTWASNQHLKQKKREVGYYDQFPVIFLTHTKNA